MKKQPKSTDFEHPWQFDKAWAEWNSKNTKYKSRPDKLPRYIAGAGYAFPIWDGEDTNRVGARNLDQGDTRDDLRGV